MDMGNRANRGDNGTTDERTDRGGGEEANEDMVVESRGLGRRVGIPLHGRVGTVHVLLTRHGGQSQTMTIHHDPSPLNIDESPEEEEEEEVEADDELEIDEEDDDDDNEADEIDNILTLQLVARLLGGSLMRRRVKNELNMCDQPEIITDPVEPLNPKTDLYQELKSFDSRMHIGPNIRNFSYGFDSASYIDKTSTSSRFLPRHCCLVGSYEARVFCGNYSKSGDVFISAGQSDKIDLYDTAGNKFKCYKSVGARDVGWSVLSTDFSPDQNWFIYSTWSPSIHLCNVYGEEERHYSLDLRPEAEEPFCAFISKFSGDNREILASANDGKLYLYDREKQDRILVIDAHQDDASAVTFADEGGILIYSGGDDGVCKVWDRRCLQERSPRPVGVFSGHKDGITYIDSKGDQRYLITNCKDQTIKLWDTRCFSNCEGIHESLKSTSQQGWDYRWQEVPRNVQKNKHTKLAGDVSVMTYTGHSVKNTLIRCHFSPYSTTGQKYIYTGCAKGQVVVYDVITAQMVAVLNSPDCFSCIRDVSWHPSQAGTLVASTWEGTIQMWTYDERDDYVKEFLHQKANYFNFW
ncbi:PREDICTED: DDB1- and CUL4-associated factor 11-like [Amphimedon queenslandica]|nr:PREDICTED: DDB1- and CUL4-associated factor 11-like [Amphimedon queenslandica]XP_019849576.1 PREDICTED: DDB1- and CUL4-associated factor 11-like [Amphimedon queenslandica]|eukprot:XP_019849571.1 PREDICTED: DDB1- and CUL4-associated factor 11-like [Amphimedon queenslandica]